MFFSFVLIILILYYVLVFYVFCYCFVIGCCSWYVDEFDFDVMDKCWLLDI